MCRISGSTVAYVRMSNPKTWDNEGYVGHRGIMWDNVGQCGIMWDM